MFVPNFMATHLVVAATLTQKDRCEPDDGAMLRSHGITSHKGVWLGYHECPSVPNYVHPVDVEIFHRISKVKTSSNFITRVK